MNTRHIMNKYKKRCESKYSKYGFVCCKHTFARIVNDVAQSFTLDILRSYKELRIQFGIFPLCYKLSQPEFGVYNLSGLKSDYSDWNYDALNPKSIDEVIEKIFDTVDTVLIPLFEKSTDCSNALSVLFEIDRQIEENRKNYLNANSIKDIAEPFEIRSIIKREKFYMSLKCGNYELAKKHLEARIDSQKKYIDDLNNSEHISKPNNLTVRSINDSYNQIAQLEDMLYLLNEENYAYFDKMIKSNERETLSNLKLFGIERQGTVETAE